MFGDFADCAKSPNISFAYGLISPGRRGRRPLRHDESFCALSYYATGPPHASRTIAAQVCLQYETRIRFEEDDPGFQAVDKVSTA